MGIYADDQYDLQRTAANPRAWTPRARALVFNDAPAEPSADLITAAEFAAAIKKLWDWIWTIEARLAKLGTAVTEFDILELKYDILTLIAQLRALEGKTDKNDRAAVKKMEELAARAALLQSMQSWPASVFR